MQQRFAEHIAAQRLLQRGERVVVAFSAGPDSLALLILLLQMREQEYYQLAVAHLDHALRPDSTLEAEQVRNICEQLGLPCFQERTDVAALAQKRGLGIEEAGREARYEFLRRAASEFSATAIAFGHQADDQVEQFWIRALRGASPASLAGMPEARYMAPELRLVRPLLPFYRVEIEAFLSKQSLIPYRDLDNFLPQFVRNQIRHRLTPLLDDIYPGWKPRLRQTMSLLAEDEAYFQEQLIRLSQGIGRWHLGLYGVRFDEFSTWPNSLRNRFILRVFDQPEYRIEPTEQPIQYRHLKALEFQLATLREGALYSLPARRALLLHKNHLFFLRDWPPGPWCLSLDGGDQEVKLPLSQGIERKLTLHCRVVRRPVQGWKEGHLPGAPMEASYLRLEFAAQPKTLRSRKHEDRLMHGGRWRKLSDLFSQGAVPLPERRIYPILMLGGLPVAVAGYITSTDFLPRPDDELAMAVWLTMGEEKQWISALEDGLRN